MRYVFIFIIIFTLVRASYYNLGDVIQADHQNIQFNFCYGPNTGSSMSLSDNNYQLNGGDYFLTVIQVGASWSGSSLSVLPDYDGFVQEWGDHSNISTYHALQDPNAPYTCVQWGDVGIVDIPNVIFDDENEHYNWFSLDGTYTYYVILDHEMSFVEFGEGVPEDDLIIEYLQLIPSLIIWGCMDDLAINYNHDATQDDGSCYYIDDIDTFFTPVWSGMPLNPMGIYVGSAVIDNENMRIGDEIGIFDGENCVGSTRLFTEVTPYLQIFVSQDLPASPEIDGFTIDHDISYRLWDASHETEYLDVSEEIIDGSPSFQPLGYAYVNLQFLTVLGCTDPSAINYNPDANTDDGSCEYEIFGCTDETACNYNLDANIDDGSCLFNDCSGDCGGSAYYDDCGVCDDNSDNDDECIGCTDPWALNFDPIHTIDDGSCEFPGLGDGNGDSQINVVDIVELVAIVLAGDEYVFFMDLNNDGLLNVIDVVILVDIILNPELMGCNLPGALNYNPDVIYYNGSCLFPPQLTDMDGNIYDTVLIGDQIWMADNLRVSHYLNGNPIFTGHANLEWAGIETGGYATIGNSNVYGYLYNWYAVNDIRGICPEGSHVPSDLEWQQLSDYLGGDMISGGALKEEGTSHWASPNEGATNSSGFTGVPGGYRNGFDGNFYGQNHHGYYWSTTSFNSDRAWRRDLWFNTPELYRDNLDNNNGFSVRCIVD